MTLVYKGHTFDEMVAAIKKNEELEYRLEELEKAYNALERAFDDIWVKRLDFKLKNAKLEEKLYILQQDYTLLEKANDNLRTKLDTIVSEMLDTCIDLQDML